MTLNRNKATDRANTREVLLKGGVEPEIMPNWLGHRFGAAIIDSMLIKESAVVDVAIKSNRTEQSVRSHMFHLRDEHGLMIDEDNGRYVFRLIP